jgi:hypothetical protein
LIIASIIARISWLIGHDQQPDSYQVWVKVSLVKECKVTARQVVHCGVVRQVSMTQ